jgi:hypothetical protein
MFGNKNRRIVFISEKVCCEENPSVDIQKTKHIHKITGSQYLMKYLELWVTLAFTGNG